MSRVYLWGYERGYVKGNPCQGVRKFSNKARDVYIPDEHYHAVYEEAPIKIKIAMEISYLCASRQGDVLDLLWTNIMNDGIFIEHNQTGKKQIKRWTPRLLAAIEMARELGGNQSIGYVIPGPSGGKLHKKTFNTWWNKAKRAAEQKLGNKIPGTFHDIKAKSISDYEGSIRDKQLFSGHKTESQVLIYDRKLKVTPTLDRPPMRAKNSK